MFQRGFYMPNYTSMSFNPMSYAPPMGMSASKMGLFGRLGNTFKSINFGSLLNNANRALGVVNQAVPLVKQVGPMFNNMRSMVKIASAFKDETEPAKKSDEKKVDTDNNYQSNTTNYSNSPNFFL